MSARGPQSRRALGLALAAALLVGTTVAQTAQTSQTDPDTRAEPPRLIVLAVIDMQRGDFLEHYAHLLSPRAAALLAAAAVFPDAAHDHGSTSTGPGHAAIATGCRPAAAGIPANEWYDPRRDERRYCVGDDSAWLVGRAEKLPAVGRSPANLERPTVGDLLKQSSDGRSLVMSLGWKDRAALLLGGAQSDLSAWIEPVTGTWVTTSALRDDLPDWLTELDDGAPIAARAGRVWEPESGQPVPVAPDGSPLSSNFPHVLPRPAAGDDLSKLSAAVARSRFGDEVVLAAARAALTATGLGRDDTPDLLALALGSSDYVGHVHGPESAEFVELFRLSWESLAELAADLDEVVGAGRWTLAVSSDHGVQPIPEGHGGRRVSNDSIRQAAAEALVNVLGGESAAQQAVLSVLRPSVWLDEHALRDSGTDREGLLQRVASAIAAVPGVSRAATEPALRVALATAAERERLERRLAAGDTSLTAADLPLVDPEELLLARDRHPQRSGQILFLLERGALMGDGSGTGHGSHHLQDRSVPVVLAGAGIAAGRPAGAVRPLDLAPTLLHLAGVPLPEGLDGRVLHEALAQP